ncbi:MAG: DMT family transporter [Proteobacteria bacterium]|nr:DMT family transporter [Pseudomonadota bacterium]MBU1583924.1 DMT family transporter [Pseudomonadota bacterium]MBU2629442.1 DMT family transporter [Pseudomonadota bacterium]
MLSKETFYRPVNALLIGALIISFSSVLVKTSHVSSTVSAFYRVFFGSFFLICGCILKKEFKKKSLKKNILAIVCGLLFALDLWTWHLSIQYVGPGLATILGNCQVFVLSIVGFLVFKEKIRITFVLSVPLAFFGLFLIIGVDMDHLSHDHFIGIALGLATAVFYSMFLLLLRHLQSDEKEFSLFYYLMVLSVACSFFLGCKVYSSNDSFGIPDMVTLSSLICLGLFIQSLAWVMISNALPKVNASHAGLILLLQPALSFVWDVLFFNRQTGLAGWIGVSIVLIAIYFGMTGKESR